MQSGNLGGKSERAANDSSGDVVTGDGHWEGERSGCNIVDVTKSVTEGAALVFSIEIVPRIFEKKKKKTLGPRM